MEEYLGWERNMFPWGNNINRHQQIEEETFIFDSENLFSNPIQDLRKPNSSICFNPVTAATTRQISSHDQLTLARMNSVHVPSNCDAATQNWSQTLTVNRFHINSTTAAAATSPDCLLSATNCSADTSSDHDEGISVIFPCYKTLYNKDNIVNNSTGVSSGDSVIKETDVGVVSQYSLPEKKHNKNSEFPDDNRPRSKKPRLDPGRSTSSTINFRQGAESDETDSEAIAQMKEMIYRAAAFRPVSFADEEVVEKPKRRNVRISSDPQTVAARQRREKISERIRVLQKLVPGGNKLDTASMLDEAANYLKFLRAQVKALEQLGQKLDYVRCGTTSHADSTSQMIQNVDPGCVTVGVPFPMQSHVLLPYQQLYPTSPPCMK